MKAPLRFSAQVAEKLRKWLTSELEPHEIYNIDQYAHHVVTIFLNEDLDIEDEPLSTVGDFLNDIYSLRSGKSLDRKKREAVQFLKKLISCDKPVEREIRRIIDELIVRIEATKDSKSSSRKLLGPLTLNVAGSHHKPSTKGNLIEQERRYNEAFPSLSIETEKNNIAAFLISEKGSGPDVWQPNDKEHSHATRRQIKPPLAAAYSVAFSDINEAQACFTASVVFSKAIPDGNLPSPDTMEIVASNLIDELFSNGSQNAFDGCWKSAFQSLVPTKLFSPKKKSFPIPHNATRIGRKFSPKVINNDLSFSDPLGNFRLILNYVDLFDPDSPKIFLHPKVQVPAYRTCPEMLFAVDADDLEVANVISWAQIRREQIRQQQTKKEENEFELVGEGKRERKIVRKSEESKGIENLEHGPLQICTNYHDMQWTNGSMVYPKPQACQTSKEGNESSDAESINNSPLLGAVGGYGVNISPHRVEEKGEVWTNNVLSFALRELAKYEMKQGRTDGHAAIPVEKQRSPIISANRTKLASTDSGTYPGGDDESRASTVEVKTISPTDWSGYVHKKSLDTQSESKVETWTPSQLAWRKTPGGMQSGGDSLNCHDFTMARGDEANGFRSDLLSEMARTDCEDEGASSLTKWNGWSNPMTDSCWNSMIQQDVFHIASPSTTLHENGSSIFQPPELSSCVDTNVSQILQRAYVNSMFAERPAEALCEVKDVSLALNCADLEHDWLSNKSEVLSTPKVVRGKTCSKWLENNCFLGVACPFSHPSI